MNAKKLACAPEDIDIHELWSKIDWDKCERFVQKLQARIVKAQREGRNNKVKALQWMLTHSFYAKALAVKRVTTNKGKSTRRWQDYMVFSIGESQSHIHSEKTWLQATTFKTCKYQKKNGKLRPLGIPTMKDRAMQALYLMALDPIAEKPLATAIPTDSADIAVHMMPSSNAVHRSFSFGRSRMDSWRGTSKGCFDHISHAWLINNIPMDKEILRKWLECGYVFNGELFLRKREPHKVA